MRSEPILQIAIQCPSSGGHSVHIARIFIGMLNDSIEYNDKDVCAMLGIFRIANPLSSAKSTPKLICFPNPTTSSLQLLFNGLSGIDFDLEMHDSSGKLILSKKFTSSTGAYYLNTSSVAVGLYHLIIRDDVGKNVNTKFMVVR